MPEANLQKSCVAEFRKLHESGCFVIPNPYDMGTAVYLQRLGFKALATTSAGASFVYARTDSPPALPLEDMVAHIGQIARATTLPVNADFQAGYADEPEGVARNVTLCLKTGVAGLSIEDSTGKSDRPLYEKDLAVERMKAARKAIDDSGTPVVLTGRCEAWLVDDPDPLGTAIDRLVAYAEAGADCLFAPGVTDLKEIEQIVKAVAPRPVNVLAFAGIPDFTVARLTDAGVRRISIGAGLALAAWAGFIRAAKGIQASGTFDSLGDNVPFGEINAIFQGVLK